MEIGRNGERGEEKEQKSNDYYSVRYARIWIEGKWWQWDEERERLVDGRGGERREKGGGKIGRGRDRERKKGDMMGK